VCYYLIIMEPKINEPVSETKEVSPLHQVTPLSKFLAMVLFIIMPFLGGWIGYRYAPEKVITIEQIITKEPEITQKDQFGKLSLSDEWSSQGTDTHFLNKKNERMIILNPGLVALSSGESCNDFLKPWDNLPEADSDIPNTDLSTLVYSLDQPKFISSDTVSINGRSVLMLISSIVLDDTDGISKEWPSYSLCATSNDGTKAFIMSYNGGRMSEQVLDMELAKEIFATALD
jgi:hypothetical protein